jgi:hypothetical protein
MKARSMKNQVLATTRRAATLTAAAILGVTASGSADSLVSFHIPNEMAPPGGVVQMKIEVTEPSPISGGRPGFAMTGFGDLAGVALFNGTGDVSGVATRNDDRVTVSYSSTTGPIGSDYPIMTLSLTIPPNAIPGQQTLFSLDPSSTWTLGTGGVVGFKAPPPAIVTVGGTVSVTGVVPGGGVLPVGTVVSVRGIGFQEKTQLQTNAKIGPVQFVSPYEIQFTIAESTDMTGKRIEVTNPDGSRDVYFSYLRGIPALISARPLLQRSEPAFSGWTYSQATFGPLVPDTGDHYAALALQNPGLQPVIIELQLYTAAGEAAGNATLTLASGARILAELSEVMGGLSAPPGGYVGVRATTPIQAFGVIGDESQGTTTTLLPVRAQP